MKKFLSLFAAILFAGSMMAGNSVEIASSTFNGSAGTHAEGWSTTGTGVSRSDCVIIGADENITSPEVDLSNYESITVQIKSRRYGTLSGKKADIAVTFDGEAIGTTEAKGTSATTDLDAIEYTVNDLSTGQFVFTCTNATSAGSTHGAGINSIVITGIEKSGEGGETEPTTKTLYCKVAQDWWKADGAAVGIYAFKGETKNAEWPGVRMTAVEGETDLWKADIDTALYSTVIFTRFNPSDEGNQDWGAKTGDLAIPADKDLYTITSATEVWGDPGVTGEWSVYGEGGDTPVEIVLPVVKLAGSLTSWEEPVLMANAEDSLSATLTLNLGIDHYQLKVVSDNNWLTRAGEGDLFTMHRNYPHVDHLNLVNTGDNIKLITDVAGEYTFTWTYADSTLVVTFPAAPAQPKFYITGNEDIVGEGNPTWGKNGALESFSDTLVMNLAAGKHKFKLITPAEQWLGMEALTDTAYGLFTDDDTNICFNIAEAGEVTVIYNATEFKVEGDFYIAPVANYYLIGDSAFVVDAGATADKAWTPDAIASFKDTTVLNLKAGVDYIMRLSLNGTWENHRDFRHLTDTAAGLKELVDEYENHSIGFQLAEAGQVTVIYIPAAEEQPEVFKLIGNFYVAPAPDPTVAVMGSMNDWAEEIPFVLSDDKTYASLTVENIGADEYEFKFIINGEWRSNGYRFHREFTGAAGITENNKANMVFVADQDGEYTFYWYFANDSAAIVYPEYIEPAKEYYAKYAPAWAWSMMTEAEGLWLTDTIVYGGIGININDKADDENNMFYSNTVEEEGVRPIAGAEIAEKDTVLFSFNPADSVVTAIMVGKYVPQLPVVGLGANFNGWDWPENLFVPAEDNLSASFKITLGVTDTIEFKIVSDGSWLSLNGEGESLYGLHRNWPKAEHVNIINDGRNFSLTTDVAGEYIFTWTYADSTLVVTFPAAPVDPTEHTYTVAGNLADAFGTAWDPANEANDMVKQEDGTYKWEKAELTLAAGEIKFKVCKDHAWDVAYPASDYVLNIPEAGVYTITITYNPADNNAVNAVATKTGDAEVTVNYYLVGSLKGWEAKAENIFTLNAEAGEGIEEYVIETTLAEGEGLKVVSSTGTWYPDGMDNEYVVDKNHAGATTIYFRPAGNAEWAAFGGYMYVVPTDPTALDEIMAAGKAVKIVRNGQILIIKGEKIFNAQGQLVK